MCSKENGTAIKERKCMVAGRCQSKGEDKENTLRIGSYEFERVDSFI
jgi:hypothetical protein